MTNITKTYNDKPFVFREDGWFNMTAAAKAYGKLVPKFMELPSTKEYIAALKENVRESDVYTATRGRNGGTWAHPKLAVFFARWLDVKFAVWCDAMIDDIVKGIYLPIDVWLSVLFLTMAATGSRKVT